MKTEAQRDAAAAKRRNKYIARQNAPVSSSSAAIWEAHGKKRIYLNNIGVDAKCYIEALECGMSVTRFNARYNNLDEVLAGNAITALIAEIGAKSEDFNDIAEALKAVGGKVSFKVEE